MAFRAAAIFVQLFFVWRIWSFCMAIYGRTVKLLVAGICLFITLTSICAFISVIALLVFGLTLDTYGPILDHLELLWTGSTAVADITITICMTIVLYRTRSTTSSAETYDKFSHLLRITVQTGFLTSTLAILVIALLPPPTTGNLYSLPWYLLGKSYMITLFANLNSRRSSQSSPDSAKIIERIVMRRSNTSSGIELPSLCSVARIIRHYLTSVPNEGRSRIEHGACQDGETGNQDVDRRGEDGPTHDAAEDTPVEAEYLS